jgi:hypothetical protein
MDIRLTCKNPDCSESTKSQATLKIPQETWMDDHNYATFFCKKCHQPLTPHPADVLKDPEICT